MRLLCGLYLLFLLSIIILSVTYPFIYDNYRLPKFTSYLLYLMLIILLLTRNKVFTYFEKKGVLK